MDTKELDLISIEIRKLILEMIGRLGVGHIGGCLSIVEVLVCLYFEIMNINPENPDWPERDRLVLSKGHAGPALYAVLAHRGYFPVEELYTLNRPNTNLPSHCDMLRTKGIDMTAGSLGQGFSAAVGMGFAAKMDKNPCTIYTIIGDGESQEGQIWEAGMFAAHNMLDNVIAFLDYNKLQIDGPVTDINNLEPVVDKWTSFGWHVQAINGHNNGEILKAVEAAKQATDKPSMIILHTIKGKGAYFAEGQVASHNMKLTEEQWREAVRLMEEGVSK